MRIVKFSAAAPPTGPECSRDQGIPSKGELAFLTRPLWAGRIALAFDRGSLVRATAEAIRHPKMGLARGIAVITVGLDRIA